MKQLIFTDPSLAPLRQRFGWALVTAFFWVAWIYLWLPLVTLLFWMLGIKSFYYLNILGGPNKNVTELAKLGVIYVCVIVALGGALLLWARLEFLRFRNVNRRTPPVPASVADLAQYALQEPSSIEKWQRGRRLLVHHDEHGQVVDVDVLDVDILDPEVLEVAVLDAAPAATLTPVAVAVVAAQGLATQTLATPISETIV